MRQYKRCGRCERIEICEICRALGRYGRSGRFERYRNRDRDLFNSVSQKGYWLTDLLTYLLSDRTDYRDAIASKNSITPISSISNCSFFFILFFLKKDKASHLIINLIISNKNLICLNSLVPFLYLIFIILLKGKYKIIAIVNTTRYRQSKSYKSQ